MTDTIRWPARSGTLELARDDIHVWAAPLCVDSAVLEHFRTTLSPEEKDRAERFKFEKHRNRFIAGRGALRDVIGHYLNTKPADLRFSYSANGKPGLLINPTPGDFHFNLAHSDDLALIAVTRIGMLGVDVECIRPVKEMDQLVARFFSPRENALFEKLPPDEKPSAFFNLWTRKEALLKATGEGITRSLSLVEVSFLPGEPARLLAISGDTVKAAEWKLEDFSPAPGFVGAVAIKAGNMIVKCGKWVTSS